MKVTVWVLVEETAEGSDVQAFATYPEAEKEAERIAESAWKDSNLDTDPFPGWEDATERLREEDNTPLYLDITHHDLDLVELIEAQKLSRPSHSASGEADAPANGEEQEAA